MAPVLPSFHFPYHSSFLWLLFFCRGAGQYEELRVELGLCSAVVGKASMWMCTATWVQLHNEWEGVVGGRNLMGAHCILDGGVGI